MKNEDSEKALEYYRAKQFELGATLPGSWKSTSLKLRHAASRLRELQHGAILRIHARQRAKLEAGEWGKGTSKLEGQELQDHEDFQLTSIYFFLMGLAIENLLKGMLMRLHPEYFTPGRKMTRIASHKLAGLCQRCNILLRDEERALLDRLATSIVWAGRYPVPLRQYDVPPINQGGLAWLWREDALEEPEIFKRVESLYTKIRNELERTQEASSTDTKREPRT